MLVVVIEEDGIFRHLKVFSDIGEAKAYAQGCVQTGEDAKVYGVPGARDARAAKAAIEMCDGNLIFAPVRQLSQQERIEHEKRESERLLLESLGLV